MFRSEFVFMFRDKRLHDDEYAQQSADDDFRPPCGKRTLERNEREDYALN